MDDAKDGDCGRLERVGSDQQTAARATVYNMVGIIACCVEGWRAGVGVTKSVASQVVGSCEVDVEVRVVAVDAGSKFFSEPSKPEHIRTRYPVLEKTAFLGPSF